VESTNVQERLAALEKNYGAAEELLGQLVLITMKQTELIVMMSDKLDEVDKRLANHWKSITYNN